MPRIAELRRSTTDSHLAGLCGGIARHWGVDPKIVRVAAALLVFSSGIGLIAYAAGWLLIPREDRSLPLWKEKSSWARGRSDTTLWIIASIVGFVAFLALGSYFPFGVFPVVVVGLVWYFAVHRPRKSASAPRAVEQQPTARAFDQAAQQWAQRVQEQRSVSDNPNPAPTTWQNLNVTSPQPLTEAAPTQLSTPTAPRAAAMPTPPAAHLSVPQPAAPTVVEGFQPFNPHVTTNPVPSPLPAATGLVPFPERVGDAAPAKPKRRTLRWWIIALCASVLALVVVAESTNETAPAYAYPAAVLLVVGLTLAVAAFFTKPRGLVAVAVIAAVVTGITAAIPSHPSSWNVGTQEYSFATTAEIPRHTIRTDLGQLRIDLSNLTVTENRTMRVRVGTGETTIVVPRGDRVRIDWSVKAGSVMTPDGNTDGVRIEGTWPESTPSTSTGSAATPRLTIDLNVNMGDVTIEEAL